MSDLENALEIKKEYHQKYMCYLKNMLALLEKPMNLSTEKKCNGSRDILHENQNRRIPNDCNKEIRTNLTPAQIIEELRSQMGFPVSDSEELPIVDQAENINNTQSGDKINQIPERYYDRYNRKNGKTTSLRKTRTTR